MPSSPPGARCGIRITAQLPGRRRGREALGTSEFVPLGPHFRRRFRQLFLGIRIN
ncbi:hypothetical protein [Streptomyces yangpuensis]|uniref:hypothetical protein n=1 Tax=Streptomyces yangpuensis TaxID=1648182 RepID=UPI003710B73C